jgi:hypothetical protein
VSSPSPPQPTQAQVESENQQLQASALLDQQENERRKRLLNAAAGVRAFAGSAIGRAAPSNTSAGGPSATQIGSFVTPVTGGTAPRGGGSGGGNASTKPF